jgi:Ca-activated chloride channel homolog
LPFQFQYNQFVLLFAGIVLMLLFFLALLNWKRKTRKKIGDANLVKALTGNFSSVRFTLKFILVSLAFAVGVVAAMNPRKPGSGNSINRKGIDVAIALDVSKSMLAADIAPDRLQRAKQFISKLMNELKNDRIALVLFAGKAYLQMPLTIDHGAAQLFVSSATPDAIPQQGTVISDALRMSANAFNPADRRFKSVILISDGEDHDEEAVNTAKELSAQGVMINTIGIGSPEGSVIIDPLTGQNKIDIGGATVISKLNENILKEMSQATNGIYLRLQNTDEAVAKLSKQLSQIDTKAFTDESLINYKTYYGWFAAAMFILLLIEYFILERKKVLAV